MPIDTKDIKDPKEQMSAVVDKKIKYFTSQQWKLTIMGKDFKIRAKIEEIVKIITAVKDFGSQVASLDPVHAGLPWAGVCVLITVSGSSLKFI